MYYTTVPTTSPRVKLSPRRRLPCRRRAPAACGQLQVSRYISHIYVYCVCMITPYLQLGLTRGWVKVRVRVLPRARRLRSTLGMYLIYIIYMYYICTIQLYPTYIYTIYIIYMYYATIPRIKPSPRHRLHYHRRRAPAAFGLETTPVVHLIYIIYISYTCTIHVLYNCTFNLPRMKPSARCRFHRLLRAPHTFDRLEVYTYIYV